MLKGATRPKKPSGFRPQESDVERVVALVEELGEVAAAQKLGLSRPTIARIMARLPVFNTTMALVRERLGAT